MSSSSEPNPLTLASARSPFAAALGRVVLEQLEAALGPSLVAWQKSVEIPTSAPG